MTNSILYNNTNYITILLITGVIHRTSSIKLCDKFADIFVATEQLFVRQVKYT